MIQAENTTAWRAMYLIFAARNLKKSDTSTNPYLPDMSINCVQCLSDISNDDIQYWSELKTNCIQCVSDISNNCSQYLSEISTNLSVLNKHWITSTCQKAVPILVYKTSTEYPQEPKTEYCFESYRIEYQLLSEDFVSSMVTSYQMRRRTFHDDFPGERRTSLDPLRRADHRTAGLSARLYELCYYRHEHLWPHAFS